MEPVRIVEKQPFSMVGLEITCAPGSSEIPALWGQLLPREKEIASLEPEVTYGLMEMQPGNQLRYMAGLSAAEDHADPPLGMTRWSVAGNSYAVFRTSLDGIKDCFHAIYDNWLPNAPYQRGTGPEFERYGETFRGEPNDELEIWIPVQPLA
jgi:predicted transcriptional regulator YdeE